MHQTRFSSLPLTVALAMLAVAGCGRPSVSFVLNHDGLAPAKDRDETNRRSRDDQIAVDVLTTMFGTPDDPHAWGGAAVSGVDSKRLRMAAGPADAGADERTGGLFRKHCVHCHGVTGDGNGPTAQFLNPYPRDFRRGIFKFKSTTTSMPPTRDDLRRTIREGINGTAMPSFKILLTTDETEALIDYVVYLAQRGKVEVLLRDPWKASAGLLDQELEATDTAENVASLYDEKFGAPLSSQAKGAVFDPWLNADKRALAPPDRVAAEIAKVDVRSLFAGVGGRAECAKCHGPTGLGDGASSRDSFDDWNDPKIDLIKSNKDIGPSQLAQRFNLPLQRLSPRNLRLGVYRGGRRPVDLFRRIALGIAGTDMPGHAAINPDGSFNLQDKTKLQAHEIWALVDYVTALPYQEGGELYRGQTAAAVATVKHE